MSEKAISGKQYFDRIEQKKMEEIYKKLEKENQKLKSALDVAREAVEFYGDDVNWCQTINGIYNTKGIYETDGIYLKMECGKKARQALNDCEAILGDKDQ